ncbi:MAG TPA: sulfate ABC transporter substrate-binding protein [Conexibacter sp.]
MKARRPVLFALLAALVALAVAGCGGASDETDAGAAAAGPSNARTKLSLVAYSTPEVVYDQVIPDFNKTPDGKDVGFTSSYGASGDQSRAVEAGQRADVVTFSTEPDMTRLVDDRLVSPDWNSGPNRGLVTTSVVAFVVRRGNPKGIRTWDDLIRPGVKVLTPNPYTSGAAKWNMLAAYGQAAREGRDPQAGLDYLRELLTHVPVQDRSGRDALQDFLNGDADVLLSYEYEATTAQRQGEDVDYVIPDDTIKINIDIANTTDAPPAARTFLNYVLSRPAQERFASWGYRPVEQSVLDEHRSEFPTPANIFTIEDLGGWDRVNDEFFDLDNGSITKLEENAGVSTAK